MSPLLELSLGIVAMLLLGRLVKPLVERVQQAIPLHPPNENVADKWCALISGDEAGALLGRLERLLFFVAFWTNQPVLVAGWLAFKVASKWNAWTNIVSVPKGLDSVDDFEYFSARRRWGSQVLMTFLVGTLANVLVGFVAVALGRYTDDAVVEICRLIKYARAS